MLSIIISLILSQAVPKIPDWSTFLEYNCADGCACSDPELYPGSQNDTWEGFFRRLPSGEIGARPGLVQALPRCWRETPDQTMWLVGDLNWDGIVDEVDYYSMLLCERGAWASTNVDQPPVEGVCSWADIDHDGHLTGRDWFILGRTWSQPQP